MSDTGLARKISTIIRKAALVSAVVHDSVDYAAEVLDGSDCRAIKIAIAHDTQRGIQGAGAGAGAAFGNPVVGAVIGALGGGASASVNGYSQAAC